MCSECDLLDPLRWHWGSAYVITWADDKCIAQRRDNRETVVADTPEELLRGIWADYSAHPVPRSVQAVPDDTD